LRARWFTIHVERRAGQRARHSHGHARWSHTQEVLMAVIDKWSNEDNGIHRREDILRERARTAHLAHQLSSMALRQWERGLTGVVALPAATALAIAAAATYGVALLERGFDVLESAVGEVGRSLTTSDKVVGATDMRAERAEARA
jgi:hydroxypyruvate isomerase